MRIYIEKLAKLSLQPKSSNKLNSKACFKAEKVGI